MKSDEVDLSSGECPDCKSTRWHRGPRALNTCTNLNTCTYVRCAGCGATFNFRGTFFPAQRIPYVAGVYAEKAESFMSIVCDREGLVQSLRRTLHIMELLGIPKHELLLTLETVTNEVREELKRTTN